MPASFFNVDATLVIVVKRHGAWVHERLAQFLSLNAPGFDILILDATQQKNEDLELYPKAYFNVRYEPSKGKTDLDLFEQSIRLSHRKYIHVSEEDYILDSNFFVDSIRELERWTASNLAYARPQTVPYSSNSTHFYSPATRVLNCLYSSNQYAFELNGMIRTSALPFKMDHMHHDHWKNSILFEIACTGHFIEVENSNLSIKGELSSPAPVQSIGKLLENQLSSICHHFKPLRYRLPLIASAINNAVIQGFVEKSPQS